MHMPTNSITKRANIFQQVKCHLVSFKKNIKNQGQTISNMSHLTYLNKK